jgi:hypothetical protein
MQKFELWQVAEINDARKYLYVSILRYTEEVEIQAGTIKEVYLKDSRGEIIPPPHCFMMVDHQLTIDCREFFNAIFQAGQRSEDAARSAATMTAEKAGIEKIIFETEPRLGSNENHIR